MDVEIIDFHTHPFVEDRQNICPHREYCGMSAEGTRRTMEGLGISKICGSVTYVGGVAQDDLLTPAEKRLILSGNARRLLNL